MKRKMIWLLLSAVLACSAFTACGNDKEPSSPVITDIDELAESVAASGEAEAENPDTAPADDQEEVPEVIDYDNSYRSELTNQWIDKALKNQRPAAIIVDNEVTALDHYGLTQADIVYEMMNSTANDEVTRLMAIVKDWNSITQFGSIRSARPSHFMIAPEYNAFLVHDGGPFYIDPYLTNPWINSLSGGFARIENGKAREFTEYVTTGEIQKRLSSAGYSSEYNSYYPGAHWQFADETAPVNLEEVYNSTDCTLVDLPFPHNKSQLDYDQTSGTYLYSEYGRKHVDPENGNKQLAFTNVILQRADYTLLDENGYMQFDLTNTNGKGYYITGGKAIPVTWKKGSDTDLTKFYDSNGDEITLNTGKTYIGLVATDRWGELVLK